MSGLRVLVCGGRAFNDKGAVFAALDAIHKDTPIGTVITGGVSGADALARKWGCKNARLISTFHPDWEKLGKAAWPARNQQMIDVGKPNLVVAFPGGADAADCVRRARAAGIEVREVPNV